MKFDSMLDATPGGIGPAVERAIAAGRDGGWVVDTAHEPFLLLATAAAAARGAAFPLGSAVAVAFARNPMLLAQAGNDLQLATRGRFVLGLGSQVRSHIERRFSMPWGRPVARMRELVHSIRAIWASWASGRRLNVRGDYYTHTLMTPAFDPGPNPYGQPPIYLGALGPAMTRLAGEVADGVVVHRLMSDRFLREVTVPSLQRGLAARATPLTRPFQVVYPPFVATGASGPALAGLRSQIAFYASTPAYRALLELHGWTEAGERLSGLARQGRWAEMPGLVTDEMVQQLSVTAEPGHLGESLLRRFDGLVDRVILYPRREPGPAAAGPAAELA